MCQFFSFTSKGSNYYYFNWQLRQEIMSGKINGFEPDSHSSINKFHGLDDDKTNKFWYNPLTGEFKVDQINIKDNRALAKRWVKRLDFNKVVEPLVIKPIVYPFKLPEATVTDQHIVLLKRWASVRASVGDSVWASVRASVGASVGDSVRASVGDSVGDSVWDSVWASVWASVWDSVGDSAGAYTSSFFDLEKWQHIDHPKGENPFRPCIDLWEQGIVPSFDGKTWRLHSGENAEIIYELNN